MIGGQSAQDAKLVRGVLGGDREADGTLVRRHFATVYAVAYSRTDHRSDAEDVAQDSFLSALQALPTLNDPRKFGPWVAAMARRKAVDAFRYTIRNAEDPEEHLQGDLRAEVERRDVLAFLETQLGRLDEPSREVLLLRYFAGHHERDIARVLGISYAATRKRLQRARETLGDRLLQDAALVDLKASLAPSAARTTQAALAVPVTRGAAADGGGSNGARCRLWKVALRDLADCTGLVLYVCHRPPGTSKWNQIEHRQFCHITQNWRGRPLVSHEVILQLIAHTTT